MPLFPSERNPQEWVQNTGMSLKAETPQISYQKDIDECFVGMAQGFVINSHFPFPCGHPLGNLGFVLIITEMICRLHPLLSHTSILISEQIYQLVTPMSHCIQSNRHNYSHWNHKFLLKITISFSPTAICRFLGIAEDEEKKLFHGTSRVVVLDFTES